MGEQGVQMTQRGEPNAGTSIWEHVRKTEDELHRKFATSQAASEQRIQNLLEENEQLKNRLCKVLQYERDYEELRDENQRLEAHLDDIAKVTTVPWEQYQHILEKFNDVEKKHQLMKRQASQYLKALETYKDGYKIYREKYERSKADVRRWQAYAQGCADKSATKSSLAPKTPDTTPTPMLNGYLTAGPRSPSKLPVPVSVHHSTPNDGVADVHEQLRLDRHERQSSTDQVRRYIAQNHRSSPDGIGSSAQDTPRPSKLVSVEDDRIRPEQAGEQSFTRERASPSSIKVPTSLELIDQNPPTSATVVTQAAGLPRDSTPQAQLSDRPVLSVEGHGPPSLVSTQSTEGETIRERSTPAVQTHYRLEDDDDEPVVVSVRNLKRKRRGSRPGLREVHHAERSPARDHDIATPIKIKDESSVDGLTADSVVRLQPENSIEDLDTISGTVLTPRKLQRLRSRSHGPRTKSGREPPALEHFRSSSLPPDANELDHRLSLSFRDQLERAAVSAPKPVVMKTEVDEELLIDGTSDSDMLDPRAKRVNTRVLTPISVNKRSVVSTPAVDATAKKARPKKRYPSRIDELAEDGKRYFDQRRATPAPYTEMASAKVSRMNNMLETPPTRNLAITRLSKSTRTKTPPRSKSPLRRSLRKPVLEVMDTFDDEYETRPEDEPLRALPVGRLNLDDFRVNPLYNQGLDYAFSEVVRSREARQCMAGCTRPECCGTHFRKVVEIGGALAAPTAGLWSSQDEIDADERTLRHYLGSEARARLKSMSLEEKREMLLRAQTEQLAQTHGRHRTDWARKASPPGFWDTGMPSTQEEEENRRKAMQIERETVEERYREAMRGNGRWKFRDE